MKDKTVLHLLDNGHAPKNSSQVDINDVTTLLQRVRAQFVLPPYKLKMSVPSSRVTCLSACGSKERAVVQ